MKLVIAVLLEPTPSRTSARMDPDKRRYQWVSGKSPRTQDMVRAPRAPRREIEMRARAPRRLVPAIGLLARF